MLKYSLFLVDVLLAWEFRLYMDFDILTGHVMDPSEYQSPYTAWILGLMSYEHKIEWV